MSNHQKIHELLAEITNPFLNDRVDSPWQESFQDVPEINRTAFESCQNSIKAVYQGNLSRGLILYGEPGSGKTHLLQRIRFFTQKEPRTWFIYVPPFPGQGRFWRHLLERFFYDICQRSKQPDLLAEAIPNSNLKEGGPGQGPLTQIEEALTRHLVERPLGSTVEIARWWAEICKQDPPGKPLFNRLRPTFDQLAVNLTLDPDVMKVLRHYLAWNNRSIAYAFLLGRDLPDEDLALLGVRQSLDDEERSKQAVLTFCRVAGKNFTIITAFDQIEFLQLPNKELESLGVLANNVVFLMMQCQNLLIISAFLTSLLEDLEKASMHASLYQRIAQDESVLTVLNKEKAKKIVQMRLQSQKGIVDLQRENNWGSLWPFTSKEIEEQVEIAKAGLSARKLINWAKNRFDELKKERKLIVQRSFDEEILDHWSRQFEKELQQPVLKVDEGVYEDGLLRLMQVKPLKGRSVHRGTGKDLHAIMEGGGQKIGISISNSENMTSLAKQLGRLQEDLSRGVVDKIIFIRDSRLPISTTATTTHNRLKELVQGANRLIRPPAETYVALNVLRQLWAKAAENDLTIGDTNVSIKELQQWLAENTPRPLQEVEWREGISPPRSPKTGREPLDSSGSYCPALN